MGTSKTQTCDRTQLVKDQQCLPKNVHALENEDDDCDWEEKKSEGMFSPMDGSTVEEFFADSTILLTGATGFLGKALLEKFLRSCPKLSRVYVLIRPKKGCSVEERFKELLENPVFDKVRSQCPDSLRKVYPIKGDVSMTDLDLSTEDKLLLKCRVNIVYHSAATVRFDEPLKKAVNLNTRGTDRVIDLCMGMVNLVSFVHVSTAYSNANIMDVREIVYSTKVKPQTIMDMCENLDDDTINILEKKLIGTHPNTYTLTKSLAEQIVATKAPGLPAVAIVRPSIVCAALAEPIPGWVDNICGITGIMMEIARGTMRSIICNPDLIVDVVPVDYVVDTLICSAWHVATTRPRQSTSPHLNSTLRVYNCTSGTINPVKWGEFGRLTRKYAIESPTKYVMWYPNITFRSNKLFHKVAVAILHFLPAFVVDLVLRCQGLQPKMIKMTKRAQRAAITGEFFAVNEWIFDAKNMRELAKSVKNTTNHNVANNASPFYVDVSALDWDTYVHRYMLGIRKYILKDEPESLSTARNRLFKLYWMNKFTQLFSMYVLARMVTRAGSR